MGNLRSKNSFYSDYQHFTKIFLKIEKKRPPSVSLDFIPFSAITLHAFSQYRKTFAIDKNTLLSLYFCTFAEQVFLRTKQHPMGLFSIFSKKEKKEVLDAGLEKTKTNFFGKLTRAIAGKSKVDDDVLDQLEEILITSDVGTDTTIDIIHRIEERVARDKYVSRPS